MERGKFYSKILDLEKKVSGLEKELKKIDAERERVNEKLERYQKGLERLKDRYRKEFHIKTINQMVNKFVADEDYMGYVNEDFKIILQFINGIHDSGEMGIIGNEAYVARGGKNCFRILAEGKAYASGRGYLDERIEGKKAAAKLWYCGNCSTPEEVFHESGLNKLFDRDYFIVHLFAEDGSKVVEFNKDGKIVKEYVAHI